MREYNLLPLWKQFLKWPRYARQRQQNPPKIKKPRHAPAQMRRFRYLIFGAIFLEVTSFLLLTGAVQPR